MPKDFPTYDLALYNEFLQNSYVGADKYEFELEDGRTLTGKPSVASTMGKEFVIDLGDKTLRLYWDQLVKRPRKVSSGKKAH